MEYKAAAIKDVLKDLGILAFPGNKVSSTQAAQIMTWRVKHEQGRAHEYNAGHVRRHVSARSLKSTGKLHDRFKLFDVQDIFALDLMPQRGAGAKMRKEKAEREKQEIDEMQSRKSPGTDNRE